MPQISRDHIDNKSPIKISRAVDSRWTAQLTVPPSIFLLLNVLGFRLSVHNPPVHVKKGQQLLVVSFDLKLISIRLPIPCEKGDTRSKLWTADVDPSGCAM